MLEIVSERNKIADRFWTNVAMTLAARNQSFVWLEKTAGIPENMSRSAKSKGTRLRLAMALKVSKALEIDLDKLLYGQYELISVREKKRWL